MGMLLLVFGLLRTVCIPLYCVKHGLAQVLELMTFVEDKMLVALAWVEMAFGLQELVHAE
jgi:hypothetical protein